jgi:hypothetical protein
MCQNDSYKANLLEEVLPHYGRLIGKKIIADNSITTDRTMEDVDPSFMLTACLNS